MKTLLRVGIPVITIVLVVVGTLHPQRTTSIMYISGEGTGAFASSRSPEAAIESLMENLKMHRYHDAYSYVANINQVDEKAFTADTRGVYADLRTYSGLEDFEYHVMRKTPTEAVVRTTMIWSTSLGDIRDTRDFKVENHGGGWKVVWPVMQEPKVPPQVVPVNYSAWNVIRRNDSDTAASVPHVRVTNVKAISHGNATVVIGEVVNDDSVPALVYVEGTLVGHDESVLAYEGSYDTMNHVLLPNQTTPFRMDFAGVNLSSVKSVRIEPASSLVTASTDPQIEVSNQEMTVDARGRRILTGMLNNQSGQIVNIPHVIAAYYDKGGQILWVSQGYVDRPLMPQSSANFAVDLPDDIAAQVNTSKVTVNEFSTSTF